MFGAATKNEIFCMRSNHRFQSVQILSTADF